MNAKRHKTQPQQRKPRRLVEESISELAASLEEAEATSGPDSKSASMIRRTLFRKVAVAVALHDEIFLDRRATA